jgi:hypothetical protein
MARNWVGSNIGYVYNMSRNKTASTLALVVALLLTLAPTGTAWADTPTLTVSRNSATYTENDASFYVDPGIQIAYSGTISGAKVSIGTGFNASQDQLVYSTTAGIVGSYNVTTGVLTLTGAASASSYEAALQAVRYYNSSETPSTASRVITFSLSGGSLYNETTGHYYEFVSAPGISWTNARTGAATLSLYGLQGYLATITSSQENDFLTAKVSGTAWIGASDAAVEGVWRWVTGPESGSSLSYSNWASGEPNNSGGNEDYCHMMTWTTPPGEWNDLADAGGSDQYASTGYVVEYGGMPGDPVLQLSAFVSVAVVAVNDPPVLGSIGGQGMTEDTGRTVSLSATDIEGNTPIAFSVSGGSVSTVTGSILGNQLTLTPAANYFTSSPIVFAVNATDSLGASSSTTFSVTVAPVNDAPVSTLPPQISGTPHSGQTLSTTNGTWDDSLDSPTTVLTFGYRWQVSTDGGLTWSNILYATNQTYAVPAADVGKVLWCAVTCRDESSGVLPKQYVLAHSNAVMVANEAPVITEGASTSVTMDEDASPLAWNLGLHATDADGDTLTWSISTQALHGTATVSGSGTAKAITYTPTADYNGSDSFLVSVSDGYGGTAGITVNITVREVNDASTAVADAYPMLEDGTLTLTTAQLLSNDLKGPANESGQNLVLVSVGSTPVNCIVSLNTGTITVYPSPNFNGIASFDYTIQDDGTTAGIPDPKAASGIVTITITPVNDMPFFTKGVDQTVLEDCGLQTVAGWATSLSAGPADESAQTLDFIVINDNNTLFSIQPAVAANGTLTYTPAPNRNGMATVTVRIHDNGGMANSGVDTSASQTFTVTVTAVNDAPVNTAPPSIVGTMNIGDTLMAAPGTWNDTIDTAISGTSTLTYTYQWVRADDVSGTNAVDIASATASSYVLSDPDFHKYLRVRVTCTDDGVGLPTTQSATPLLTPWTFQVINCLPVITEGASIPISMDEDGSPLTWNLTLHVTDADSDTLTWSMLSQPLHGTATASGTGTAKAITYTSAADYNGSDSFVVRVSDGYGGTAGITVNITVNPRNDTPVNTVLPTISGIPHTGRTLTVTTGTWNDDTDLVPGSLEYTFQWQRSTDGGVMFIDIPEATGPTYVLTLADNLQLVRFKVTCTDDGEGLPLHQSTSALSAPVPVAILNMAPVITEGAAVSVTCDEDENPVPFSLTLHATDADEIDMLMWSIAVPPAHGTLALSAGPTGSVTVPICHPVPNWNGTDSFTLRVEDGLTGTDEITVTVTVSPRNDAPVNIVKPSIDGNLFVNREVHAVIGNWNDNVDFVPGHLTYTYQWLRARDAAGTGLVLIPGAIASTYAISPIDEGMYIAVCVICTDDGEGLPVGMSTSVDSAFLPARYLDITPPTIELPDFSSWPGVTGMSGGMAPSFTVNWSPFDLQFMVEDNLSSVQWRVSVNSVEASSSVGTGTTDRSVSLTEGANRVDITAVGQAGNRAERHLTITLDAHAPEVVLPWPLTRMVIGTILNVEGIISDELSGVRSLRIDGTEVIPYLDGTFTVSLPLKRGLNTIAVETLDNAGNHGSFTWVVDLTPVQQQRTRHTIDLTIDSAVMVVDGASVTMDVAPVIRENRTLLPLRALLEELGGSIAWNAKTRQVTVKVRGVTMVLTIGKNFATVNGKSILIDAANKKVVPIILGSRTFLPLQFVAEQLGLDIAWYAPTRTVTITWEP